jgi:hypothetical protein
MRNIIIENGLEIKGVKNDIIGISPLFSAWRESVQRVTLSHNGTQLTV